MVKFLSTALRALLVFFCAISLNAFAVSNSPATLTGLTLKGSGTGCSSCHGAAADPNMTVTIAGPTVLAAGAVGTYTVTSTKSGIADGTRAGVAIAASDSPTPLAVAAGMPTSLIGGEVIHDSTQGALRTTASGTASYQFSYTMPASASVGTTHTLFAVSAIGNPGATTGWRHAANFTVTTTIAATGQPVMLDSTVTQIAAGNSHNCALTASGSVKCWGSNPLGQLGNGTTTPRTTLSDVLGLGTDTVAIAAGSFHSCALSSSGGVRCWGQNGVGQLGDGTTTNQTQPVTVAGLTGVVAIAAGEVHTCVLTTSGGVKCWGGNNNGQLGNGSTTTSAAPVDVSGLTGVVALTAGLKHTCAVTSSGGAKCWGQNQTNQLGDSTTTTRLTPVDVRGVDSAGLLSGVTSISGGSAHTCAVSSGGAVCWGSNNLGQIGNGTTSTATVVQNVSTLTSGVATVSAGLEHSCAVTTSGAVKCWGRNTNRQLGDDTNTHRLSPVDVIVSAGVPLLGAAAVSAGANHTCAANVLGGVKCWGHNGNGQIGDGSNNNDRSKPVDVIGLSLGVLAHSTGRLHACAVTPAGGAVCWGDNSSGQLGDGTTTNRLKPVPVKGLGGVELLSGVTAISAGDRHTCAVFAFPGDPPVVSCWGSNDNGQLGDGTTTSRLAPVQVIDPTQDNSDGRLSSVSAIAAGLTHTCAIKNGRVKCWGSNGTSELGNGGSSGNSTKPVEVTDLQSVGEISAGRGHTCARFVNGGSSNGGVKCWGNNGFGQLGDGTTTTPTAPVQVSNLTSGASAISLGGQHSCAFINAGGGVGVVRCWGLNSNGQLGNNSTTNSSTPVTASGLTEAAGVTAGQTHTCSRTTAGTVKCWGSNTGGELGDGSVVQHLTPVDVSGITTGVVAMAAGTGSTCSLSAGSAPGVAANAVLGLKCWGSNANGQLGDGTTTSRSLAADVRRSQSIGFVAPTAITGSSSLSGTGTSGLDATFDSWTPSTCTVSGNSVVITASGLCGIRASQVGSANNAAAPQQLRLAAATFVAPVNLAITRTGLGSGTVVSTPTGIDCGATCVKGFPSGSAITLVATPAAGSSFAGWSGGGCTGTGQCIVTLSGNILVVARFDTTPQFQVTVTPNGTGSGTTTSSPAGISCGATCSGSFNSGSTVTLTASPSTGSTFTNWSGSCSGVGQCILPNLSAPAAVTASFALNTYAIVTAASPTTGGIVSCSPNPVPHGSSSTCTATASSGFALGSFSGDCTGATCALSNVTSAKSVTATFTVATATRLINISTRGQVSTGDGVMIGGFIISGTANKKVLIRAIGPNLANFGISGTLPDPKLELYEGSTPIGSNDNWQSQVIPADVAAITATGLAPANVAEAALLVTLKPGVPYTAVVTGAVSAPTGVGIVEVFEIDHPEYQLINISTRGRVQSGEGVMIGGFIIQGDSPKTVLIRAVGPNLANFGVSGVLADPTMDVYRSSDGVKIAQNDDWQTQTLAADVSAIAATGLSPVDPRESAMLLTLPPGAYTAVVSGKGGGTGVGIVEVFAR